MDYATKAIDYAKRVVEGAVPASSLTRCACQRFLSDLEREGFKYVFEPDLVNRACSFMERLPHTKGQWAARGELFILADWQIFVVANLFGWINPETGWRRFRESYVEVPRKNGKSLFAAAIGLYMMVADGEFGAEVYSGATTEKQAWEIFRPARQIVQRLPALQERFSISINAKSLVVESEGNRFEPIVGNPGDGASPSCALVDEFHEHVNSDLVDTMKTGMGAREQPLLFQITTAGADMGGPCYETRGDMIAILKGTVEDDSTFALIYTIDEDVQWDTEDALEMANPNIGVSVSREFLLSEMEKARRSATKQASFKTKHLNMWVGAKAAWLNMLALQRCKDPSLKIEDFYGRECVVAVDLASKLDVACVAYLFEEEGEYTVFVKHYLPYSTIYDGSSDRYRAWADSGYIEVTDGNVTDFRRIAEDICEMSRHVHIREIAYDPWQATQFALTLSDEGFDLVEVRQTVQNFSEPMKQLEAVIVGQKFHYDGDPVLTWMAGNVTAKLDKKDNIFPDKERQQNKIDGIVAIIMGFNRMVTQEQQSSVYDERGVLIV